VAVRRRGARGAAVSAVLLLGSGLVAGCGALPGQVEGSARTAGSGVPAPSAAVPPAASTSAASSAATLPGGGAPAVATGGSAPAATLQSAFEQVRSGVVRFEVSGCSGSATGSGFELAPDLVATAAHVVTGGQVVEVVQGTTATAGVVVGIDPGADVALVRTATPLTGHRFTFSPSSPRVGDQVAAIGFPEGDPLSFNTGTVNGLGRKAVIDGIPRHDLLEIDAATTHGSSGGPVIREDGSVVGLVDAGPDGEPGRRLAVSSGTAAPLVAGWRQAPQPVDPGDCSTAVDLDGNPVPPDRWPTAPAQQALGTLSIYFAAVNGGDFPTALAQLVHQPSLSSFTAGTTSTQDSGFDVRDVQDRGDRVVVWLEFTSHQDPGRGPADRPQETCTDWSLDYVLARHAGLELIEGTQPHAGPASAPCADPSAASSAASSAPASAPASGGGD
jgi:serine protease Do